MHAAITHEFCDIPVVTTAWSIRRFRSTGNLIVIVFCSGINRAFLFLVGRKIRTCRTRVQCMQYALIIVRDVSQTNWRQGWDSNPRTSYPVDCFQDSCIQPNSATLPVLNSHSTHSSVRFESSGAVEEWSPALVLFFPYAQTTSQLNKHWS